LEKIRAFYTDKDINIFKDAVSLPGVSLHYLLRGMREREGGGELNFTALAKRLMKCEGELINMTRAWDKEKF